MRSGEPFPGNENSDCQIESSAMLYRVRWVKNGIHAILQFLKKRVYPASG